MPSFAILSVLACFAATTVHGLTATAWYAGWHADQGFPLSAVSWNRYTQMTYAFAETTPDVNTLSLLGSNPDLLPQFVTEARKHGVKAKVSIGGWTGSRFFSINVGSAKNRTAFVKTVTSFAEKYKLDGVDFDWEYPGNQGLGCNIVSGQDTTNFLAFLKELRQNPVGAKLMLSAATATTPFMGPNGTPLSDVSQFALYLDQIAIMNYDISGPWSATVGPNAPLRSACMPENVRTPSAETSVQAWNAAGIPLNKLLLGVPAYGHSFRVRKNVAYVSGSKTLALYPVFDAVDPPVGDEWDDPAGEIDKCGVPTAQGGVISFWGLIKQGYLNKQGVVNSGVPYLFDQCTQTPYVYNATKEVMISYDNPQSFSAKGKFIKDKKLGGFAVWEAGGDSNNLLLDAIRTAAGF